MTGNAHDLVFARRRLPLDCLLGKGLINHDLAFRYPA
jgi:hypothetical protein